LQECVCVLDDIKAICKKAGIDPRNVYEIRITPIEITFHCYDLKNGRPYFNEQKDEVAKLPPVSLKVR